MLFLLRAGMPLRHPGAHARLRVGVVPLVLLLFRIHRLGAGEGLVLLVFVRLGLLLIAPRRMVLLDILRTYLIADLGGRSLIGC